VGADARARGETERRTSATDDRKTHLGQALLVRGLALGAVCGDLLLGLGLGLPQTLGLACCFGFGARARGERQGVG
jgi:hypothetical protein